VCRAGVATPPHYFQTKNKHTHTHHHHSHTHTHSSHKYPTWDAPLARTTSFNLKLSSAPTSSSLLLPQPSSSPTSSEFRFGRGSSSNSDDLLQATNNSLPQAALLLLPGSSVCPDIMPPPASPAVTRARVAAAAAAAAAAGSGTVILLPDAESSVPSAASAGAAEPLAMAPAVGPRTASQRRDDHLRRQHGRESDRGQPSSPQSDEAHGRPIPLRARAGCVQGARDSVCPHQGAACRWPDEASCSRPLPQQHGRDSSRAPGAAAWAPVQRGQRAVTDTSFDYQVLEKRKTPECFSPGIYTTSSTTICRLNSPRRRSEIHISGQFVKLSLDNTRSLLYN